MILGQPQRAVGTARGDADTGLVGRTQDVGSATRVR
jgi:hypothetical protein